MIGQYQHARPHADPAEVGDRDIGEYVPSRSLVVPHGQDHARRQQRHQLPEGQERGDVARRDETDQREAERTAERDDHGLVGCLTERVARIEAGRHSDHGE